MDTDNNVVKVGEVLGKGKQMREGEWEASVIVSIIKKKKWLSLNEAIKVSSNPIWLVFL